MSHRGAHFRDDARPGTTLWYHDHSLGITRLDVYTGQEGFFFVREPAVDASLNLPSGPYEIRSTKCGARPSAVSTSSAKQGFATSPTFS
jgi:hypothetical protein